MDFRLILIIMLPMNKKEWFSDFIRGTSFGLGMVPGVSAGTMAIVVGIYEKLVGNISRLRTDFKKAAMTLIPICLGAVLSAITLLIAVHFGYNLAPFAISCLFTGLLLGTLPIITRELSFKEMKTKDYVLLVLGFLLASGIGILSLLSKIYWHFDLEQYFVEGLWWIYPLVILVGFVAMAACIVPGISGAMILHIFGLYQPTADIYLGENSIFHNIERIPSGTGITLCLLLGIVLGAIASSKIMNSLITNHRQKTFEVVLGFVLGSIPAMYLNQDVVTLAENGGVTWIYQITPWWEYLLGAILLIAAAIGFYFVSKKVIKKQAQSIDVSLDEPANHQ